MAYSYSRQSDLDKLLNDQTNYADYQSAYTDAINKAAADVANQGTYTSQYTDAMNDLQNTLANRSFSYDPETDETYQQYKKSYTNSGKKAAEDSYGIAAARTGGLGSSYAASAATQAYNNYMQQLADKIPELKQLAYTMYQGETSDLNQQLQNYLSMDQNAQNTWSNNNSYLNQVLSNYLNLDSNALNQYNSNLSNLAQKISALQTDKSNDNSIYTNDQNLALSAAKVAAEQQSAAAAAEEANQSTISKFIAAANSMLDSGQSLTTVTNMLDQAKSQGLINQAQYNTIKTNSTYKSRQAQGKIPGQASSFT